MKTDEIDARILTALMEDGRASFREIARRTSLTTPTVSARFARMKRAGLIRKFVPVFSPDWRNASILALVTAEVDPASAEKVAKELARLAEVEHIYMTTDGITLRVALGDVKEIQPFLRQNLLRRRSVKVTGSQVVTGVVKEEPASLPPRYVTMDLECDYCHGAVTGTRPYTISLGSSRYYFCCRTCKKEYLAKHGTRLTRVARRLSRAALQS